MIIKQDDNFIQMNNKYIRDSQNTNDVLNSSELTILTLMKINQTITGT